MNAHKFNILYVISFDVFLISLNLLIYGDFGNVSSTFNLISRTGLGIILASSLFGFYMTAPETNFGRLNKIEYYSYFAAFYINLGLIIPCLLLPAKYDFIAEFTFGSMIALFIVLQIYLFAKKKL